MAKLNRGAFSPDDVEDAKRGHPAFDPRDYAARRDLEFLDHGTPAGFRAALPCEEELQSNVLRGVLPGGEYGVMAHEGLEIGYSGDSFDWGGTFYSVRVTAKGETGPVPWWVPAARDKRHCGDAASDRKPDGFVCCGAAARDPTRRGQRRMRFRSGRTHKSPPAPTHSCFRMTGAAR
jgi:hypothetical protein